MVGNGANVQRLFAVISDWLVGESVLFDVTECRLEFRPKVWQAHKNTKPQDISFLFINSKN